MLKQVSRFHSIGQCPLACFLTAVTKHKTTVGNIVNEVKDIDLWIKIGYTYTTAHKTLLHEAS